LATIDRHPECVATSHFMDALFSLFDVVAGVGELLGRSEEKDQELDTLASSVESISQSVRMFAVGLPIDERDEAFCCNKVFAQLVGHLTLCKDIIERHKNRVGQQQLPPPALDNGQAQSSTTFRFIRQSLVSQSSRTVREGLEVLSGKLGALGGFALPEDELEIMRKAGQELHRLVPVLMLAISVYRPRAQKRSLECDNLLPATAHQDLWRRSISSSASEVERAVALPGNHAVAEVEPSLQLQLVSDHPAARTGPPLPALNMAELRPIVAASSSSLESAVQGAAPDAAQATSRQLVFGRQELKDRVPKSITLTSKGIAPQPLSRFVSRDLFALDVPLASTLVEEPEDSLNMSTLVFGDDGSSAGDDLLGATLAWGCGDTGSALSGKAVKPPPPLAEAMGLSTAGLHVRTAGETRWQWMPKERKVEVRQGDRIAILLESPPGSSNPGPPKDLELHEATCLLGIELQPPVPRC